MSPSFRDADRLSQARITGSAMFDLGLSEEERLVQETARRFALQRLAPKLREHERMRRVSAEVLREFSDLGLAAIGLPEAGGAGIGAFGKALVLEELGAADAGAALALEPLGLASYPLGEARPELLRRAGMRASALEDTGARLQVRGDTVCGSWPWIVGDELGALVILGAEQGIVVAEGIERTPVEACGLEAAGASSVCLVDAPIAARIDDVRALDRARARMRLHVAALLVGVARAASAYSMRYATERTAFGRPIAHHQGLAFLLVDMATAVDAARMAVWSAAAAIDRGFDATWESASALAEAAEQALFVGPSAVQVLGGHGFMKDHPVEKYMRDIRALAQLAGGRDEAELAAASRVVDRDLGLA